MITEDNLLDAKLKFYEADADLHHALNVFQNACAIPRGPENIQRARLNIIQTAEKNFKAKQYGQDLEEKYKLQELTKRTVYGSSEKG